MIIGYGDKGFQKAINRFEKHITNKVKQIVAETVEMAVSQMKTLAPTGKSVGSGLKDKIEVEYYNGGLSARIVSGAFYSIWVEFGTGIYSTTGAGRKTPWVYYVPGGYIDDNGERSYYVYTHGMEAQPFWYPSLEVAFKHFRDEMNKIG
jgi:HK97 gp10 family phage protein